MQVCARMNTYYPTRYTYCTTARIHIIHQKSIIPPIFNLIPAEKSFSFFFNRVYKGGVQRSSFEVQSLNRVKGQSTKLEILTHLFLFFFIIFLLQEQNTNHSVLLIGLIQY